MSVNVGAAAPGFDLESDRGARLSLADFKGKWLVLYFYPRDNTPGCTREAQEFSASVARLEKLGAAVAGVSRDSVASHCGFRDKFAIRFPLLSDPDLVAHRAYGAWGEKTMYGRRVEGTIRSTFLVDPKGRLAAAWRGVKVDGHADKVLEAIAEQSGARPPGGGGSSAAPKAAATKAAAGTTVTKKAVAKTTRPATSGSAVATGNRKSPKRRAAPK